MSKKSRERREKYKTAAPDEYFTDGVFEMARIGEKIVVRNNANLKQQEERKDLLLKEYPSKLKSISDKLFALKEKVLRCNPYELLMYLRARALMMQMNILSESDYSTAANSILRAQEYVQSIIVSSELNVDHSMSSSDEEELFAQIETEFEKIYEEIHVFYYYWAAYIQKTKDISDDRLKDIVEAQYMYWIRGNRYQVFELEPLKSLLPPHNDILKRLFGGSADEIITGLGKLRYSLSQGIADAAMELREEFYSFCNYVDSGVDPQRVFESSKEHYSSLMGRFLGSDLINVKKVTGWDDRFIALLSLGINECDTFWCEGEFQGWPIVSLPVVKRPFIKLNEVSYAFLYYALFDNIYRIIQKGILQQERTYLDAWKEKQAHASEEMVCNLFLRMLPGAETHIGNYYPVKNTNKQMNENDIIVVYHNYLFVIEVKAGSFPTTPPITDFDAHIKAYHNLAEVADSQCSRTIDYIKKHPTAQFYDQTRNPTFQIADYNSFNGVFTFSVTVDNFNEFAAKAEKLSIISMKEETIVISVDDLLVYAQYFQSPIQFLHYLKQRQAAMRVPQFQMHDELDHLGLYIDQNLYALNPAKYENYNNVLFQGFRKPLDEYFNWLYTAPSKATKPTQKIPEIILNIIEYLDGNVTRDNISFAHFLLDLSADARDELSQQILYVLKRQHERHCQLPLVLVGEIKLCIFVSTPDISTFTLQEQMDYVYALASRNENVPVMMTSLQYDINNSLIFANAKMCFFSDVAEEDMERLKLLGQEKAKIWVQQAAKRSGKIGRNDYCPCGSGKKYKHCCGRE